MNDIGVSNWISSEILYQLFLQLSANLASVFRHAQHLVQLQDVSLVLFNRKSLLSLQSLNRYVESYQWVPITITTDPTAVFQKRRDLECRIGIVLFQRRFKFFVDTRNGLEQRLFKEIEPRVPDFIHHRWSTISRLIALPQQRYQSF